jgi:S-ribosylhomocysteine lyase LuxS involved in autoinducer biosynthesis
MNDSILVDSLSNKTLECMRLQSSADKIELDAIAYMLFLETWLDEEESISDLGSEVLKSLRKNWTTNWIPALNEKHCGDCTKVSSSCIRCCVEQLYEEAARIIKESK